MLNKIFYFINTQISAQVPEFDMNEIPPLPAFQAGEVSSVEQAQAFLPDNSIMIISLIIVVVISLVLIFLYWKSKNKFGIYSKSASILQVKPRNKKNKKDNRTIQIPVDNTSKKSNKKIAKEQDIYKNIQEEANSEKNSININKENYAYGLATPKSVENCIKIFLEITKDK